MFLSIIICAYNSEKYIKRCLDSIISQDFLDYEIILVNDGSTDYTKEIAQSYKMANLTLIDKENTGLADSRNIGLKKAKGDYIWFVDSDDELERESLNTIYSVLMESDADILRFNYRRIGENAVSLYPSYQSDLYEEEELDVFRHSVIKNSYNRLFTCWMHIYKRKIIQDIRFVNEKEYAFDDTLFNSIVYQLANRIQTISSILYRYIENGSSITKRNQSWTRQLLNAYFYLKEQYIGMNIYDDYKDDLLSAFLDFAILGNGEGRGGSLLKEYLSSGDIEKTHAYVKEVISSFKMQKMMEDIKGHRLSRPLMVLYQCIMEKDEKKLFHILCHLNEQSIKDRNEKKEIHLNCHFEYMKLDDLYTAIPVQDSSNGYNGVLRLNREACEILQVIEKYSDIEEIQNELYRKFREESKEDINENLEDLIVILKSEGIINC